MPISVETVKKVLADHRGYEISHVTHIGAGRDWEVFRGYVRLNPTMVFDCAIRIRLSGPYKAPLNPPERDYHFHDGGTQGDYSFHIYQWIEGESIEDRYARNPELLTKAGAPFGYLPSLAEQLRAVHKTTDAARPFATGWWEHQMRDRYHEAYCYCMQHRIDLPRPRDPSDPCKSAAVLLHTLEPNPTSLLHGDLSNRNILLKTGSLDVALIDFDASMWGDYMWDIANWGTFNDGAPDQWEKMMRLYHGLGDDEMVSAALWKRFHVYLALISVSKLAHLHRLGYRDLDRAIRRVKTAVESLQP